MEAQDEDISISSQISTLISKSNSCWEANEIVTKKETDELGSNEAVGSSDENRHLSAYPPIPKTAIKEELMEIEDQSQEIKVEAPVLFIKKNIYTFYIVSPDVMEASLLQLVVLGSVGIANHLPVPISFKRRYSTEDEAAEADNDRRNEVTNEQSDQIIELVIYFLKWFQAIPLHV